MHACMHERRACWGFCREKDLNEVVQTTTIFANVSKGVLAKHEDMQAVFGSTDEDAICRRMLQDGDLQVPCRHTSFAV
jgi:ribosome maturation protein SDO1